ncbi:MAG: hypothetical protein M3Z20_12725, partial [Chloroflexota bacterium]|nr:hypothetical protein [Chloroflexota bacterium]
MATMQAPARPLPRTRAAAKPLTRQRPIALLGKFAFFLLALLIVVWSVGPFLWMAITSIKPDRDLAALPPILPTEITFSHYFALFEQRPFYKYIINSTVVSISTTLICLVIGSLAG